MANEHSQEMKLSEEIRKEAKFYRKNWAFTLVAEQLKVWAGKVEMLEQTNEQLNAYCQELEGQLLEANQQAGEGDESTAQENSDS